RPPRCRAARPARPPSRSRGRVIRAACATVWYGTPRPARARTGSRAPPPDPGPAETARTPRPARSLAGLQIIRRGYRYRTWLGVRLQRRLDEAVGDRACARDTELLEQEREVFLEVGRDRAADVGGQIPHAPLERPDRLLAALVVELLLGVPLLPLVLALRLHPLLELAPQVGRQLRVVEHDVLEIGRQVDLDRLALGEAAERLGRQRRSPVLHRAAQAVLAAGVGGQGLEGVEVQLHLGDRAVGEHDTAVARAGLYGDLADARVGPPLQARERADIAVHEGLELMHVGVLAAHLADLRAHGHGHALGLPVPDEFGQVGGPLVVDALLGVERRLGEIDQRGRVDVDVVEAGVQLLFDQGPYRLQLGLGVNGVLLGVHLDVVALDEQRPREALAQRRGGHHGDVLGGARQLVHGGAVARRRALEPSQRRCGCVRHRLRSLLATNLDRAYLDDQPVVGGRDARRQTRRELRMRRRVGEVREEGPARTD